MDAVGRVHVAWSERTGPGWGDGDTVILYSMLGEGFPNSAGWTAPELVSTGDPGRTQLPSLAVDPGDNIHVTWGDRTGQGGPGAEHGILYRTCDGSSGLWSEFEIITSGSNETFFTPSIDAGVDGDIHVAWWSGIEEVGTIHHATRTAATASWDPPVEIALNVCPYLGPSLAVDAVGEAHVSWDSFEETNPGIFYRRGQVNVAPSISGPGNVTVTRGKAGNLISWMVVDATTGTTGYQVLRNGTVAEEGAWSSSVPVTIGIDGLDAGFYNYTIVAWDGLGGWARDTAIVTVVPAPPGPMDYLVAAGIVIAISAAVIAIIALLAARGKLSFPGARKSRQELGSTRKGDGVLKD